MTDSHNAISGAKKSAHVGTRKPHSRDVLEKSAGHVLYEWRMLNWAAKRLNETGEETDLTGPSPERNSIIECHLLHLRNLVEFFSSPRPRVDDIVAVDYLSQWSVGDRANVLSSAWDGVNKRISHVTTARVDTNSWLRVQSSWQAAHNTVVELWRQFQEQLDPSIREWFQRELSAS